MATVGSHQQATFTIPINGTSPVDADEVRLNDNAMATSYNAHDNDATLHVQSSTLALRPVASTVGRLWFTTDEKKYYYDTGTAWTDVTINGLTLTQVGTLTSLTVSGTATIGNNIDVTGEASVIGSAGKDRVVISPRTAGTGTKVVGTNNANTAYAPVTVTGSSVGIETGGETARWSFTTAGHLEAAADNTYNIGASGANRPATVYAGTGVVAPTFTGALTGNAATATKLNSSRTFALTGDVTGSVSSDLTSGASVATTYTATVPVAKGGTGLTGTPSNGQVPIGNGTGYTLATLTGGTNISITNAAGAITINATGLASAVSGTGTTDYVPRWVSGTQIGDSAVIDNGSKVTLGRSQLQLNTVTYTVPSSQGAASTVLQNDGSGNLSWATSAQPIDVQTFDSSGTWSKPSQGSVAYVEVWGAGGSGAAGASSTNRNGGAGGGYMARLIPLSSLGATETVTVGAGGASRNTAVNGQTGGNSNFGTWVYAYGGSGGTTSSTPADMAVTPGTPLRAALGAAMTTYVKGASIVLSTVVSYWDFFDRTYAGGWASIDGTDIGQLRNSVWGGGGGSSQGSTAGTSQYGGAGGAMGVAGSTPAGGGGGATGAGAGVSGAGGSGRVKITVW